MADTQPPAKFTNRGFAIYDEVPTDHGTTLRVQESSDASGPHVWLFIDGASVTGKPDPHLTYRQAKRLRAALDAFLAHQRAEGWPDEADP